MILLLLGFIASTLCYSVIGMRKLCLLSVGAGVIAFCLALLLKEEKRNVSGSGLTVPELLQVCWGRRIIVFSLIALIQQGIPKEKKSTAMGFFQAVYAIGMTTFPMFTGSIVSVGGMESGYLVLAGIAILGIIIAKVYYIQEICRGI